MQNDTMDFSRNFGLSPLLLTINQVAQLLGIGRTSTYELVMSGQIQSVKLGRRRLVPRSSVEGYVKGISGPQNVAES